MDPKWYHVCWPRLTAKRVEPVVSISWASCSHYLLINLRILLCDVLCYRLCMYIVNQKTKPFLFCDTFGFCWPIGTFSHPRPEMTSAHIWNKSYHFTLITLPHYCAKCDQVQFYKNWHCSTHFFRKKDVTDIRYCFWLIVISTIYF